MDGQVKESPAEAVERKESKKKAVEWRESMTEEVELQKVGNSEMVMLPSNQYPDIL